MMDAWKEDSDTQTHDTNNGKGKCPRGLMAFAD
jgi:hypothetical protein